MPDFTFYTPKTADGEAQELLEQVEKGYGFVPNLFGYMAEAPVTIKAYMQLDKLLEESSLSPAHVQIALLTASVENNCNFCKTAHHAMANQAGVDKQTVEAIFNQSEIENAEDRAISETVAKMVQKRGWLDAADFDSFYSAGFSKQQYLELVLAVTIKTLSNYSNHATQPQANPQLKEMAAE